MFPYFIPPLAALQGKLEFAVLNACTQNRERFAEATSSNLNDENVCCQLLGSRAGLSS